MKIPSSNLTLVTEKLNLGLEPGSRKWVKYAVVASTWGWAAAQPWVLASCALSRADRRSVSSITVRRGYTRTSSTPTLTSLPWHQSTVYKMCCNGSRHQVTRYNMKRSSSTSGESPTPKRKRLTIGEKRELPQQFLQTINRLNTLIFSYLYILLYVLYN